MYGKNMTNTNKWYWKPAIQHLYGVCYSLELSPEEIKGKVAAIAFEGQIPFYTFLHHKGNIQYSWQI